MEANKKEKYLYFNEFDPEPLQAKIKLCPLMKMNCQGNMCQFWKSDRQRISKKQKNPEEETPLIDFGDCVIKEFITYLHSIDIALRGIMKIYSDQTF